MPQNRFNASFYIKISPSLQKGLMIAIPHILVFILVLSISVLVLFLKSVLILLILLSAFYYSRIYLLNTSKNSVLQLKQNSLHNWWITTIESNKKNELFSVDLLPTSFISKWLIILNFVDNNGSKYNVFITADSISNNKFRNLYSRIKLLNNKKD
jgi:hypothetical protein